MSEYIVKETGYPGTIKQEIVGELVRCKDCRHFFRDNIGNVVVYRCELNHEDMRDDFYCADGERREDDG